MHRLILLLLAASCARTPTRETAPANTPSPWTSPPLVALTATTTKKPDWDVEAMPGETFDAKIAVDEGTWISLDVSPDGRWIAFDLLGDLYLLRSTGGEARSITSGAAWDIQPRFSPDGEWIAFISDRDGMDNVWVIRTDGSDARPVTEEKEHEMASPAWSPDGRFLAARKHFTSERSLGAGEVWLYHRSGGGGLMMTKRPTDQKDLGEPAFSPDGRYLYFSQDVTPGSRFEYNKDPHKTIYQIRRLDRESGRIEAFIAGAGGSVTPTPSPDGRTIAFVRRVGLKTGLFTHDVESGEERMLYDALDRDMQETWAVQGVYPSMAWTPDSRSIVFWAGGKIRRVDVGSKKATVIPFSVKDTRRMHAALRFPVDVEPKRFHTKMLRWVTVSPDERHVVFQTLGRLYIRRLPDGTPRRLTTNDEPVFEQHPSFSRDGRFVVYTTWSDHDLGTVRVVPVTGGRGRVVTRSPGHYVTPVFTPSGERIVYRKAGWDVTRPRLWTHDPGLYVVDAKGGEPELVTRQGRRPHFGAEEDRVYFLAQVGSGEKKRRILRSIELDGSDLRTHLKSKLATELLIAPTSRYVAFRETYQTYVAPFSPTGRPIDIGPDAKSIPVVRVSKDSGVGLHFTGGGKRLHWSMGPQLFTRDLEALFREEEKGEEPKVQEEGIDLGFDVPSYVAKGKSAFVGARIVTMKGNEVIEDGALLVVDGRIAAVGPRASVEIPKGTKVFDTTGATLVPGFVDVHHHGPQGEDGIIPQANWNLYAMLAFGVTTVHDPSSDTATFFAASELARAGEILAPRLFSTGTILYGARYPIKAEVNSLEDARNHLKRMKSVGAFSVKSYRQRRRSQRQQILTAARELKMMVVPEGGSMFQHNMNMIVDGHTGIEHAIPVAAVYDDVLQLWSASEVGYTPTMVVGYGGIWGENYWYQESDVFAHPRLTRFVPPFVLNARARRRMTASKGDWNHFDIGRAAKKLADAGVRVNTGAHGQREGLALHWELWMMVQGGMTPHEALRTATLNGARYLGLDRDVGSIEPGKLADLAIIDGNVLEDIRASEKVRYTVLGGRVFEAATMTEIHPKRREPPKFYWQR